MNKQVIVDLFAEDQAHEKLLEPMIRRVAREQGVDARVRVRAARGGHGRALAEYETYQQLLKIRQIQTAPHLIVVAVDGNCARFGRKRQEIERCTTNENRDRVVAACPDPHVERWFMADPDSFCRIVGARPKVEKKKCVRDHYKKSLENSIRQAGHPATLGGLEFAEELVEDMDLYRAAKSDHSLRAFLDHLKDRLRATAQG